jgi:DNA-3-methyladenine glycosylase
LIRRSESQTTAYSIIEVEAYRGEEDEASHARFGKTSRNRIMYARGGLVYVYLIYGMYWMLNMVTGPEGQPQAVLIRGLKGFDGPGRLTRALGIDRSFYGEDLAESDRLWLEPEIENPALIQTRALVLNMQGNHGKVWRRYRLGNRQ